MSPEAILLSIRDQAGEGSYRFSCPSCMHTVEKPADRKVVALLLSAGVELEEKAGRVATSTSEPVFEEPIESRPSGPAFTMDDLITFHFLLEDDEALFRALHGS
jgi:hypothetical protein